ncbi:hypothetical protein FF1_014434 [Malus domestica]
MSHLDPRIAQFETEVRRIIDLQSIAQSMPDTFIDLAKVTRLHIPAANTLARIDTPRECRNITWESRTIPKGGDDAPSTWPNTLAASQSSAPTMKHGKPLGLKHSQPQKRKTTQTSDPSLNPTIAYSFVPTYEVILDYGDVLDKTTRPPKNHEISIHYAVLDEVWNQNEMIVDDVFVYTVATNIMLSDDVEPRFVDEC